MYLYVFILCLPPALDGGGGFAYNEKRLFGAGGQGRTFFLQEIEKPYQLTKEKARQINHTAEAAEGLYLLLDRIQATDAQAQTTKRKEGISKSQEG